MNSLHHKATFAAQKNFSSAAFLMPVYLVNPNNCVNTHTHIRATALKQPSRARNIQHKRLHTKGVHEVFS